MAATEGQTFGLSIIGLDEQGNSAASARDAHTLFASWFMSNLSSHDVSLVFPKGRLFQLTLLDDAGTIFWQSPDPTQAADYTVVVAAGGHFAIPIDTVPPGLPQQQPFVPLADIIKEKTIPSATELNLGLLIPLASGSQRTSARLWRAF
jgi:hypothetical protein